MSRRLLLGLLFCHLALVAGGAAHLTQRASGTTRRLLHFYETLTGAGERFSYFAPTVYPQVRARLVVKRGGSTLADYPLERSARREINIRLGLLAGMTEVVSARADVRQALMGAMAAQGLSDNPTAEAVTVIVEEWRVPAMADFVSGHRGQWHPLYETTFAPNRARIGSDVR